MARSLTSWAATALLGGNSAGWLQGFFVYKLYLTGDPFNIFMAMLAGPVFHAYMHAPQSAIMSERAPTRMCNSGLSFGYQVTDIVAVSFAPIIAVFLMDKFDWAIPIAIYAKTPRSFRLSPWPSPKRRAASTLRSSTVLTRCRSSYPRYVRTVSRKQEDCTMARRSTEQTNSPCDKSSCRPGPGDSGNVCH